MSTDWSSERDPRESFRAVLINIACEIVDPKEVQCLRFLVDADRSAEVESALEVFQLMLKKGRFSFSNVEPLKEVLENVNRYDLVSKYLENYMCRQRLWEAASNQTVGMSLYTASSRDQHSAPALVSPPFVSSQCHYSMPEMVGMVPSVGEFTRRSRHVSTGHMWGVREEGEEGERVTPRHSMMVSGQGHWTKESQQESKPTQVTGATPTRVTGATPTSSGYAQYDPPTLQERPTYPTSTASLGGHTSHTSLGGRGHTSGLPTSLGGYSHTSAPPTSLGGHSHTSAPSTSLGGHGHTSAPPTSLGGHGHTSAPPTSLGGCGHTSAPPTSLHGRNHTSGAPPTSLGHNHASETTPTSQSDHNPSTCPLSPVIPVPLSPVSQQSPQQEQQQCPSCGISDTVLSSVTSRVSAEQMVGNLELEQSGDHTFSLPFGISTAAHRKGVASTTKHGRGRGRTVASAASHGGDMTSATTHERRVSHRGGMTCGGGMAHGRGVACGRGVAHGGGGVAMSGEVIEGQVSHDQGHEGSAGGRADSAKDLDSLPRSTSGSDTHLVATQEGHSSTEHEAALLSPTPCNSVEQSLGAPGLVMKGIPKRYPAPILLKLSTQELSSWIGDRTRIGMVLETTDHLIPVKCTSRVIPMVTVEVIPRASLESRMLTVRASLLIPTRCSRHKWLVEYADSAFYLGCSINKERTLSAYQEVEITSPGASMVDHVTTLSLDVVAHDKVLYDKAEFLTLSLHAEVVVYGYHGESAKKYKLVELEDPDYIEIVRANPNLSL